MRNAKPLLSRSPRHNVAKANIVLFFPAYNDSVFSRCAGASGKGVVVIITSIKQLEGRKTCHYNGGRRWNTCYYDHQCSGWSKDSRRTTFHMGAQFFNVQLFVITTPPTKGNIVLSSPPHFLGVLKGSWPQTPKFWLRGPAYGHVDILPDNNEFLCWWYVLFGKWLKVQTAHAHFGNSCHLTFVCEL